MLIENPYAISSSMEIVMFAPSVTVCKIFTVEICITVTLTTRIGHGQMQIYKLKAMFNFLFVGNSNVYHICHHLQDNHNEVWRFGV